MKFGEWMLVLALSGEQSNFGDYCVMRMSDMPQEMNVVFLDSNEPDGRRRDRHAIPRTRNR